MIVKFSVSFSDRYFLVKRNESGKRAIFLIGILVVFLKKSAIRHVHVLCFPIRKADMISTNDTQQTTKRNMIRTREEIGGHLVILGYSYHESSVYFFKLF